MATSDLPYVAEGKFPRDVRKSLNEVVDRINTQKWEVKFTEDLSPQGARVEVSDDRCVILIPRGGLLGASAIGGFALQTQTKPGHSTTKQWAVYPGLLKNTQTNIANGDTKYISVTGCLLRTMLPTDTAWADIPTGASPTNPARLWIEVAYPSWPTVDSAQIKHTGWNGGELEYKTTTDDDGNTIYPQSFARYVIGQVTSYKTDGSPIVVPYLGCAQLQLVNGGDMAFDNSEANPLATAIIFPQ